MAKGGGGLTFRELVGVAPPEPLRPRRRLAVANTSTMGGTGPRMLMKAIIATASLRGA